MAGLFTKNYFRSEKRISSGDPQASPWDQVKILENLTKISLPKLGLADMNQKLYSSIFMSGKPIYNIYLDIVLPKKY